MSQAVTLTLRVPSRRTLLVVAVMVLLAVGVWLAAVAWAAGPPSKAGVATVPAGKASVVVLKPAVGIDITSASKVQATAMTSSTVGVRSVVPSASGDTLTIRLTGKAPTNIRVAWSVSNGTSPADRAEIAALEDRVAQLEQTLTGVSRVNFQGQPTIRFSGVNVQVVDGQDEFTDGDVNGLGNVIIGWNERSGDLRRDGSHNLVIGRNHSYSSFGGLVAGLSNTVSGEDASVVGGSFNTASGARAVVSGGSSNVASGEGASISGGFNSRASASVASVSGGIEGLASGVASSVSGGTGNDATGYAASVSGGTGNTASGLAAWLSGGSANTASGGYASVSGGAGNVSSGEFDSISGGDDVTCNVPYAGTEVLASHGGVCGEFENRQTPNAWRAIDN
jgi:hypothetical protein